MPARRDALVASAVSGWMIKHNSADPTSRSVRKQRRRAGPSRWTCQKRPSKVGTLDWTHSKATPLTDPAVGPPLYGNANPKKRADAAYACADPKPEQQHRKNITWNDVCQCIRDWSLPSGKLRSSSQRGEVLTTSRRVARLTFEHRGSRHPEAVSMPPSASVRRVSSSTDDVSRCQNGCQEAVWVFWFSP
jgi:hypothetical protein